MRAAQQRLFDGKKRIDLSGEGQAFFLKASIPKILATTRGSYD
jgi:hypothetical protein